MPSSSPVPDYVTNLMTLYGSPSQAGFGTAVFYEVIESEADLEAIALCYYQYFVGDLWDRFGEAAWMSSWKQVYRRPQGAHPDLMTQLKQIADPSAAQFVPLLLLNDPAFTEKAQSALMTAYDDPTVTDLRIYTIGDGEAMSGLLLSGWRTTGEVTLLVALLD